MVRKREETIKASNQKYVETNRIARNKVRREYNRRKQYESSVEKKKGGIQPKTYDDAKLQKKRERDRIKRMERYYAKKKMNFKDDLECWNNQMNHQLGFEID
jgi:hypothetical protein